MPQAARSRERERWMHERYGRQNPVHLGHTGMRCPACRFHWTHRFIRHPGRASFAGATSRCASPGIRSARRPAGSRCCTAHSRSTSARSRCVADSESADFLQIARERVRIAQQPSGGFQSAKLGRSLPHKLLGQERGVGGFYQCSYSSLLVYARSIMTFPWKKTLHLIYRNLPPRCPKPV